MEKLLGRSALILLAFAFVLTSCGESTDSSNAKKKAGEITDKAGALAPQGKETSHSAGDASGNGRAQSVAILGDNTRQRLAASIDKPGVFAAPPGESSVEARVKLVAASDATVIAVDATQSVLPIHREDVLLSRHFSRGQVAVVFTNTEVIDDSDLLDLEEVEMRELMKMLDLDGDHAAVLYDSEKARTPAPKGLAAIRKSIGAMPSARPAGAGVTAKTFQATIYVLTQEELYTGVTAQALRTGKYQLVFATGTTAGNIQVQVPVTPGKAGTCQVMLDSAANVVDGASFVLSASGHVTAAGRVLPGQQQGSAP